MAFVLAIEPDDRQAALLGRIFKRRLRADLAVVDSKDRAIAALAERMPDLILLTALLSPREEDELVAYLRGLAGAAHIQTLRIPLLADGEEEARSRPRGLFGFFQRRPGQPRGCDPDVFAGEVWAYLERAAEIKAERASAPSALDSAPAASAPSPDADEGIPAAMAVDSADGPGARPDRDSDDRFFTWSRRIDPLDDPRSPKFDEPSARAERAETVELLARPAEAEVAPPVDEGDSERVAWLIREASPPAAPSASPAQGAASAAEAPLALLEDRSEAELADVDSAASPREEPPPLASTDVALAVPAAALPAVELVPAPPDDEALDADEALEIIAIVGDEAPPPPALEPPETLSASETDAQSWLFATIQSLRQDLQRWRSQRPRDGQPDAGAKPPSHLPRSTAPLEAAVVPPGASPAVGRSEVPPVPGAAPPAAAEPNPHERVLETGSVGSAAPFVATGGTAPGEPPSLTLAAEEIAPDNAASEDARPHGRPAPEALREGDLRRLPPLVLERAPTDPCRAPAEEELVARQLADLFAGLKVPLPVALVSYPRNVRIGRVRIAPPPSALPGAEAIATADDLPTSAQAPRGVRKKSAADPGRKPGRRGRRM